MILLATWAANVCEGQQSFADNSILGADYNEILIPGWNFNLVLRVEKKKKKKKLQLYEKFQPGLKYNSLE